jgi:hypothetical protein
MACQARRWSFPGVWVAEGVLADLSGTMACREFRGLTSCSYCQAKVSIWQSHKVQQPMPVQAYLMILGCAVPVDDQPFCPVSLCAHVPFSRIRRADGCMLPGLHRYP